jgi:hypothetical protein
VAREAIIRGVGPYDLHGVRYYQIFLSYLGAPDRVLEVRLPHDVVYADPRDGDHVEVEALLSMVTGFRKVDAPAG